MAHGISYEDAAKVEKQYEQYKKIIENIKPCSNVTWQHPTQPKKLGLCIVEPRCHELLSGILHNMAYIYGNTDTVLYIVHGSDNEQFVKDICKSWINVKFFNLGVQNITRADYNNLLTNKSFWTCFATEYILMFQTDSFIRKKIPEVFYHFDYVGAPWSDKEKNKGWSPAKNGRFVGNGGFSLRKLSSIKEICSKYEYDPILLEGEDVFFSKYLAIDTVPPPSLARQFSVEHFYYEDPVGFHQCWRFQTIEDIKSWIFTNEQAIEMF